MTARAQVRDADRSRLRRDGRRPGVLLPSVMLVVIAMLGGLALAVSVIPGPGETLADIARSPDLLPARVAAALPGIAPTWIAQTLDGLAAGMVIFVMAVGVTLILGVMGIAHFAQGAFVLLGIGGAALLPAQLGAGTGAVDGFSGPAALGVAALAALAAAGAGGAVFQQVVLRPAGPSQRRQIVAGVGGLVIVEQLLRMAGVTGAGRITWPDMPFDAIAIGGVVPTPGQVLAICAGLGVFGLLTVVLRATRAGLVLRAAMQDREMVAALGYRVGTIGAVVFALGAALAGLGGLLWMLVPLPVTSPAGAPLLALILAAVLLGGAGSVTGCLLGALMIGLTQAYAVAWDPRLDLAAPLVLLVLVLIWRPAGLLARTGAAARA